MTYATTPAQTFHTWVSAQFGGVTRTVETSERGGFVVATRHADTVRFDDSVSRQFATVAEAVAHAEFANTRESGMGFQTA